MCVLSDCVVRNETGLWVIRLHYLCEKACVPNCSNLRPYDCIWTVTLSCLRAINLTRDHSACMATWPAVGTGQWPLGTNSAQFTVYRLRHRCPTARTAARPIPEGMTIFCLVSFTTGAVRSAMPATAGFLVLFLVNYCRPCWFSAHIFFIPDHIWYKKSAPISGVRVISLTENVAPILSVYHHFRYVHLTAYFIG